LTTTGAGGAVFCKHLGFDLNEINTELEKIKRPSYNERDV